MYYEVTADGIATMPGTGPAAAGGRTDAAERMYDRSVDMLHYTSLISRIAHCDCDIVRRSDTDSGASWAHAGSRHVGFGMCASHARAYHCMYVCKQLRDLITPLADR